MLTWISALTLLMWLPYIIPHIGNVGQMPAMTYQGYATSLPDWAARAKKSHYNAIENLAPFAAFILVANLARISNNATATAAVAYFWFRAAHYLFYIVAVPFGRSLTFTGGWLAQLYILYLILSVGS